jgi:hypothetical protein
MNQCDDDEKKNEKEKNYKSVFEISLSTAIIAVIIVIIIVIILFEEVADRFEDCDTLSVCFVEFFISVSFLREED